MTLLNLKDFTFLVPTRLGHKDRIDNLRIFLKYMNKHFDTNIIIGEQDKEQKFPFMFKDVKNVNYLFHKFDENYFWRSKIINLMALNVKTPYLVVIDNDIIMDTVSLDPILQKFRNNEIDYATKFGKSIYDIVYDQKEEFESHLNPHLLEKKVIKGTAPGCYIVKTPIFFNCGMENEYFYGWGCEDLERDTRFKMLGLRSLFNAGQLWHLEHTPQENKRDHHIRNTEIHQKMKKNMRNINDLKKYIVSFPWLKEYNIKISF